MSIKYCIPRRNWLLRGALLFGIIGFIFLGYYYRVKVVSLANNFDWMKSVPARSFHNNNTQSSQTSPKVNIPKVKRFDSESQKNDSEENVEAGEIEYATIEVPSWTGNTLESEVQSYETDPVEIVSFDKSNDFNELNESNDSNELNESNESTENSEEDEE